MKYYKLLEDMDREGDIICFSDEGNSLSLQLFCMGKKYSDENKSFCFFYDEEDGDNATDFLANDKGWFIVSVRLKEILESMNTDIQFLPVMIKEKRTQRVLPDYYIANILKVVDALCLERSEYFVTDIEGIGKIYSVVKYGIFAEKTEDSDVFKLAKRQEIPIFVSERFKDSIEEKGITGIDLLEIQVYENV